MSDLIVNPVKRATAGRGRKHSRLSVFAATAATAGVLGAAGAVVASAPWSAAAGDTGKTGSIAGHSAALDAVTGAKAQLDALRSPVTGGSTAVDATAHVFSGATHQAAKAAVDKTAKPAPAKPAPAKPAQKPAPAKPAEQHKPAKPYQIYDSVTPGSLPTGKAAAVYANGAYAASASQVGNHKSVLWIDTNGSNPGANVLDVEPGDATPAAAAAWAQQRLAHHPHQVAIIYTMLSTWQAVKDHVAHLPKAQQDNVRYWIADPTGVDHIVPGASATQWYWGPSTDVSTASPALTQAG